MVLGEYVPLVSSNHRRNNEWCHDGVVGQDHDHIKMNHTDHQSQQCHSVCVVHGDSGVVQV